MLDDFLSAFGAALLLLGLAVASIGLYGLLRKRDIFEQLHAAGLVTGPGVILILLASLATGHAETVSSAVLVIGFVLITSSLSTHALALAAWRRRERIAVTRERSSAPASASARPGDPPVTRPMRIVVAHDGSPGADVAVRLVASMAWPAGCRVRLIAVAEGDLTPHVTRDRARALERETSSDVSRALDSAAAMLEWPGLLVDRVVRTGQPAGAILDEASAFGADLVVVGSRGLGWARSLLAGSVAKEVVERAPVAVLVARTDRADHVLLATDGSPASTNATDIVARWPAFAGSRIRVLSVATGVPTYPASTPLTDANHEARQRRIVDAAAIGLIQAGRRAGSHLLVGDAVSRILGFARAESVDLIVLGSRGRTGITRAVLGSVARDVVSSATASVLVVPSRPSGGR